jgi:hypothetical protein
VRERRTNRKRLVVASLLLFALGCLLVLAVVSRRNSATPAPLSRAGVSPPVHAGSGCTTVYFIDRDCDGYGVGKKASGDYPLFPGGIVYKLGDRANWTVGDMPDADDDDPAVRTPAEWRARWGGDNRGMVRFLAARKGFANAARVWYVSLSGSDAAGVVNDPDAPFATPAPALNAMHDLEGGVIVVRGGDWGDRLDFNPCAYHGPCYNLTGTPAKPVYVLAYPGERVVTTKVITSDINYWPKKGVSSVTFDGLILSSARYGLGDGVSMADTDHMTFVNCEFAGWHQLIWANHTEDAVIRSCVFHDMMYHAIYFGSCCGQVSQGARDLDFALDAAKYAAGQSVGASYRGSIVQNVMYNNGESGYEPVHINTYTTDNLIEGNIISYSGGTGIGLQSGVYRATVRNNVIVYPGACGITLSLYGAETQAATLRWNVIENNTIYVGRTRHKIRNAVPGCGILMNDYSKTSGRWIKDVTIRNNIVVVDNSHPQWGAPAVAFGRNSYPRTATIDHNLFWTVPAAASSRRGILTSLQDAVRGIRAAAFTPHGGRIMTIAADASPDQGQARSYGFAEFEEYGFRDNLYADPLFRHADPDDAVNPGFFDFSLQDGSPARQAGAPEGAPPVDVKGNRRSGRPEIGAYQQLSPR